MGARRDDAHRGPGPPRQPRRSPTQAGAGEVAAQDDIRDRAVEPAVPYHQENEEDTRGHFSDPARTQLEVDGKAHAADVRGDDGSRLTVRDQISCRQLFCSAGS